MPEDHAWFLEWVKVIPIIMEKYKVKSNPVDVRQGLESVVAGLDELRVCVLHTLMVAAVDGSLTGWQGIRKEAGV